MIQHKIHSIITKQSLIFIIALLLTCSLAHAEQSIETFTYTSNANNITCIVDRTSSTLTIKSDQQTATYPFNFSSGISSAHIGTFNNRLAIHFYDRSNYGGETFYIIDCSNNKKIIDCVYTHSQDGFGTLFSMGVCGLDKPMPAYDDALNSLMIKSSLINNDIRNGYVRQQLLTAGKRVQHDIAMLETITISARFNSSDQDYRSPDLVVSYEDKEYSFGQAEFFLEFNKKHIETLAIVKKSSTYLLKKYSESTLRQLIEAQGVAVDVDSNLIILNNEILNQFDEQ